MRYPQEERPKFLTCQKFIRPSDCLSGETYRFSFPPVHCTNTARQTTHDKAEIRPNSKNSRTSQNSAQNRMKIARCMPGLNLQCGFESIILQLFQGCRLILPTGRSIATNFLIWSHEHMIWSFWLFCYNMGFISAC